MERFKNAVISIGRLLIVAAAVLSALAAIQGCSGFSSSSSAYEPTPQDDDALLTTEVRALMSTTDEVRTGAERKLISIGQSSGARRELVINKLLSSVKEQKELDGTHNLLKTTFLYWESVTNIFAELNATEAADVLITCVQCSNGYTGTMGEPPASYALVRMGKPILPKLSKALNQETDSYKKVKLVLCIARIGGSEAMTDLEQALQSERDNDVRELIKSALSQMNSHP